MDHTTSSVTTDLARLSAIIDAADAGQNARDPAQAEILLQSVEQLLDCQSALTWAGDSPLMRRQVAPSHAPRTELLVQAEFCGVVLAELALRRDPARPFGQRELLLLDLVRPHVVRWLIGQARRSPDRSAVTERQFEILALARLGMSNKQIGQQLRISGATVRKHLENAFARLGVASRTAAVSAVFGSRAGASERQEQERTDG